MNSEQTQSLLTLARLIGGAISSERDVADGILATCVQCRDAKAPDDFTNVGMAVRQAILAQAPRAGAPLRSDLQYLVDRQSAIELANLHTLGQIARLIGHHGLQANEEAVLLGDTAVLLGLYRSLSVYQASLWVVAVRGALTLPQQPWATEVPNAPPFDSTSAARPAEEPHRCARRWWKSATRWRIPTGAAGDIRGPRRRAGGGGLAADLVPPRWKCWRGGTRCRRTWPGDRQRAEIAPKVHRGFAVVRMVFRAARRCGGALEVPLWSGCSRAGLSDAAADADTETALNQSLPWVTANSRQLTMTVDGRKQVGVAAARRALSCLIVILMAAVGHRHRGRSVVGPLM
jgi:hypothetical protein